MDFFGKVSENWLKWISLPFAFLADVALYVFAATELNDLPNVVMGGREYLLLAIPFVLLLVIYTVCCFVHWRREKQAQAQPEEATEQERPKPKNSIWWIFGGCALALVILFFILVFSFQSGFQDGRYVIWAEQYHVALSPEVHKSYYLEGDAVQAKGDELTDYPKRCVVELDFNNDGTFTITYGGQMLGVEPEKNGVGYGGKCTSVLWELVEIGENIYYIRNVGDNTYLKWYEAQENWTSHPNIVEDNKEQYQLHLSRVG